MSDLITELKKTHFVVPSRLIDAVEDGFLDLEKSTSNTFYYNEFRINNLERIKKKRPKVLIGGPLETNFPNLHTIGLLEVADVVCLTSKTNPYPYKATVNFLPHQSFFDLKLPAGFTPDFFWDNQVEKGHPIPKDLEKAPFPLIASVCHTFYHLSIEAICSFFDRVLPLSAPYGAKLEKKFPGKTLNFPFGLNWASFDEIIVPKFEKTVDVCLTFPRREDTANEDRRIRVIALLEQFKQTYGDRYKIQIVEHLSMEEYIALLRESLITINVVGFHGPYNYRTIEALSAGSMVFQLDWGEDNRFEGLFKDGIHGVGFTFDTFEKKLLYYLEHKEEAIQIAKQGLTYLKENYSYRNLYLQLIEEAKKVTPGKRLNTLNELYYYQCDPTMLRYMDRPEEKMVFKYDLNHKERFFALNIELLKAIDDPVAQAICYQKYLADLPSAC